MSSQAVKKPAISSPEDFQQFIQFGQHRLPIDTAVTWRVSPTWDYQSRYSDTKKQIYQVEVRLNTLKKGKPYGYADYNLKADTLWKAYDLIRPLSSNNVKWVVWLETIDPLSKRNAIHLTFSKEGGGPLLDVGRLTEWGVFRLFDLPVGVCPEDSVLVEDPEDKNAIDLVFEDDSLPDPALQTKKIAALARMEKVFADNVVFNALVKNGDPRFQVKKEEQIPLADISDTFRRMGIETGRGTGEFHEIEGPTYASNHRTCIFEITEDAIKAGNRFISSEPSEWTGKDIPYLISNHEHAPANSPDLVSNREHASNNGSDESKESIYQEYDPVSDEKNNSPAVTPDPEE